MRSVIVRLAELAKEKILAFAEAVDTEIGGLMTVTQEGRTLTVHDAWTIPQQVSVGNVDFEPGHFEDHMKAQGWIKGKPMPHICMGIWHSHANASTFMSGTDENDLVRKFAMRGFLVNLVVNRKGEMTCQVDSMVGPENGKPDDFVLVTVPNVLTAIHVRSAAVIEQVNREIAQNVKAAPRITYVKGDNADFQGHFFDRDEDFDLMTPNNRGKYTKHLPAKGGKDHPLGGSVQDIFPTSAKGRECWVFNTRRNSLDCFDADGILLKRIDKGGRGKMTLFDAKGKPLMITNNRTGGPKAIGKKSLDEGIFSTYGPAEL